MKVFMLGWEFPPFISGGLGTACYGLTKAMDQLGIEVTFVLPKIIGSSCSTHANLIDSSCTTHVNLLTPESHTPVKAFRSKEFKNVKFRAIDSPLQPYTTPGTHKQQIEDKLFEKQALESKFADLNFAGGTDYHGDMNTEVHRYAAVAVELAENRDFDIIHAHDWMTYPAGIAVAAMSGKPLVIHVHSTEFDRSGEHVNQRIYDIERQGMERADKIIAVSYLTRNIIISRYGISGDKVEVVHNGVERNNNGRWELEDTGIKKNEKIVLFLGRITMQKGPEYFLMAAKKVLEIMDNVKFVMAGSGDLMHKAIEMSAQLGIGSKVLFTGFLRGEDVTNIYKMADLFVMPSVSEPFGIVPLEALDNDVPVIISKQSGVSEVLTHVLKVDFWDVKEMANKIVAVLKYPPLEMTLRNYGNFEVRKLRWKDSAEKCIRIYNETLACVSNCRM
ncbi:MAG: glycosyltransferase family 1 protein [Candidatus Brocadiia bacterium]|nr:MAG: glycosyltransferase family 1 protein [Candidatus Brocadiia bacterium]